LADFQPKTNGIEHGKFVDNPIIKQPTYEVVGNCPQCGAAIYGPNEVPVPRTINYPQSGFIHNYMVSGPLIMALELSVRTCNCPSLHQFQVDIHDKLDFISNQTAKLVYDNKPKKKWFVL